MFGKHDLSRQADKSLELLRGERHECDGQDGKADGSRG